VGAYFLNERYESTLLFRSQVYDKIVSILLEDKLGLDEKRLPKEEIDFEKP
jgi:hypothetical protein